MWLVLGPFLGASWPAVKRSGVPRVLGLSGFGCACWRFSRSWRSWGRFRCQSFRLPIWGGASAEPGPVPWPLGLLASGVPCWACSRFLGRCCRSGADLVPRLPVVDFLHALFHLAGRVMRHKRGRVCRIGFRRDLAGARRGAGAGFPGPYSPLEFFPGLYSP